MFNAARHTCNKQWWKWHLTLKRHSWPCDHNSGPQSTWPCPAERAAESWPDLSLRWTPTQILDEFGPILGYIWHSKLVSAVNILLVVTAAALHLWAELMVWLQCGLNLRLMLALTAANILRKRKVEGLDHFWWMCRTRVSPYVNPKRKTQNDSPSWSLSLA